MDLQKIAKSIYDDVVREGMSTDYCYSPDFLNQAKAIAKQRAEHIFNHTGKDLNEICSEIDKL